jgi:hypothetical protein
MNFNRRDGKTERINLPLRLEMSLQSDCHSAYSKIQRILIQTNKKGRHFRTDPLHINNH